MQKIYASGVNYFGLLCREAGDAGVLGVRHPAQRNRKRAVRQPVAAPFGPVAQHNHPDIQGVRSGDLQKIKGMYGSSISSTGLVFV